MNTDNDFYVYAYLDPRKSGIFEYDQILFDHEPFYIGKGVNDRCFIGLNEPFKCFKRNKINAIIKDGCIPIVIKLYEKLTESESFLKEIELIKIIGRSNKKKGPLTNLTDGGEGGYGHIKSEEAKIKIGLKHKGKKLSKETKEKISKSNTGKKRTQIIKDKLRESHLGIKCHSSEWIKTLSKPVCQFTTDNVFIAEFASIKEASEVTNVIKQNISSAVRGKYKTSGGFIWRYKNKEDVIQGHLR